MAISSSMITFIDTTDTQKVDVHISSNYPITQIYDTNEDKFTPNWEVSGGSLRLTATIYADSTDVSTLSTVTYQWFKDTDSGVTLSTTRNLAIRENVLQNSATGMVTYVCKVVYNGKPYENRITFSLVKTGENGTSAPTVKAQYSIDGTEGSWETFLNSAIHQYIRFSYDDGRNWTEAIRITGKPGEDGKSIELKGVAYAKTTPVTGRDIELYLDINTSTPIANPTEGDSYLVDGYLCVYNGTNFICTGKIQGPQGQKGDSYYLFIRYADNTNGDGMSLYPEGKSYIGFYSSSLQQSPTDTSSSTWNWKKFVGEDAKSITLIGNAQAFKVNKNNTISPETIEISVQAENTSVSSWSYKTEDDTTFVTTIPSGVSRKDNLITITGSDITSDFITIKASDGVHSDIFTVYKVSDGVDGAEGKIGPDGQPATTVFLSNEHIPLVANSDGQVKATTVTCNVIEYRGTEKVTPTIGVITDLPEGMSVAPNCGVAYTNSELAVGNVVELFVDQTKNVLVDTQKLNDGDSFVVDTYLCRYNKANNNFVCDNVIVSENELKLTITIADNTTLGSTSSINERFAIPIVDSAQTTLWLNWSKVNAGAKGDNAPAVKAQYSANGTSGWTDTLNTSTHKYVRFSYDDGATWSAAMKIVGDDAKSIVLNASAQVFKVDKSYTFTPTTITVTAQAINTAISTSGWTYSIDGGKTFTSTVPTGVVRSGNTVTITGSTLVSNSIVIKASDGTYSDTVTIYKVLDGVDAPIAFLTNENITFSANSQGQISGTSITSNVVAYKGTTKVVPIIGTITGAPTGMTITSSTVNNETKLTITVANNSTLGSNSSNMGVISIPVTSPVSTTLYLTWSKVNTGATGASIKSTTVWYGVSDSASTRPTDSSWQSSIPVVEEGKYLWTRTIIDYTDDAIPDTVTYTYTKQGSTGAMGPTGSSGTSVTVKSIKYQSGTSATTAPTGTWSDNVVAVAEGNYLWTQTTFSDNKIAYGVAKQGQKGDKGDKGDQGVQGPKGNDGQQYYTWVKYADTPTSGMSNDPDGKTYIGLAYNKTTPTESTIYSDYAWSLIRGETGAVGPKGDDGKQYYTWIKYADSATGANMSDLPDGKLYIGLAYNKTTSTESNVASDYTWALFKGDKGDQGPKGNDAYTVMLTNESHIFTGDISNAIAGSTTTQVLAYNGSVAQTVTIVSVNGKTAATTDTDTGITGLKFKCSALSGATPTITFTCTTSFVSKSGSIPIVLSVGGVSFTKMFTYSIAFKGATGSPGNPGSPGTPASLVNVTPSALYFKSTTGKGGTFTPDYIYLYPRFQTVSYSKWEYSTNGGTSWTTVTSGYNGLTIGTYNSVAYSLQIAKNSALYTDTVTSISFRCVSSNTSVYDTVSIVKIYDVVDLQIGGRNLILASNVPYSNSEYRVASYNMSEDWEFNTTYTLTLKGTIEDGKIFGAWANGSGTRVATLTYDAIKGVYTSTFVTPATIATQTPKVINIYNTPSTTPGSASIEWIKLEKGNKATDWTPAPEDLNNITFQIYAPDGYLLTNELQSLTLQTFPYEGSIEITSGATFQWSQFVDNAWIDISGATDTTLTVTKADVLKAKSYRCVMEYKSKTYTSTITVQDKTDSYDSVMYVSSNTTNNEYYWVLYTLVYTEAGEVDPLLGPVDISTPSSPVSGDYWYAVDTVNMSVKLKKYDGTSWVDSTDTQSLSYSWDIINDGSTKIPLSGSSKVKVVSSHHFTTTATVVCEISSLKDGLLTHSSLSLTDASDPIVSNTEPTATVNGQIWIKANDNGTYLMFIWDESGQRWISSDMDTRNKVYTSKPSSYNAGDLWITASDVEYGGHYALAKIYSPDIKYYTLTNDSYVEANPQPTSEEQVLATQYYHYVTYLQGTLLQAQFPSTTYNASDWAPTLKYDKDFDDMKETLNELKQYVDITGEGLRITARDSEGNLSPFSSLFTSDALTFYQDTNRLLTLANNQLTAPKVVIEDELEVRGEIKLGDLKMIIESNGSFSFAVEK